jgi:hypothetical protein
MTTASTVGEKDAFGIDEANVTIGHFVISAKSARFDTMSAWLWSVLCG